MVEPPTDPDSFFTRPDIFPLAFGAGHLELVPMSPDSYRQSIFTDRGRIVPSARRGWQAPTGQLLAEFERRKLGTPPIFFIFHIAHCGSTLLARAVDVPGRTLVIREPFALRQLAVEQAAPGGPRDRKTWERCLRLTAGLLGRRFAADQPVIVKANVPVNFMIETLMAVNPESRGLLLYADFDSYLLSVLKTPMHRRWVGNVTRQLAAAIKASPGMEGVDPVKLDAPRAAACLWLAQLGRFHTALADGNRLQSLDCNNLYSQPAKVVAATLDAAGAPISLDQAERIAAGELFRRHAKDPARDYDNEARARDLESLSLRLAPELEEARTWAMSTPAWAVAAATPNRSLF